MRTCSCEPCSCLEPCLEIVPGTLLGNHFWEPYLQADPENLTVLGNLFLDTSSWIPAWEPLPGNLLRNIFPQQRKLGVFSHRKNKISNQIFQEQVRKPGYQERFPSKVPKNKFPSKVPRNRFLRKVVKKASKNRFASKGVPGKVPGNRFPSKVRKTRFPSKVRKNRFTSKVRKNRFTSKGSKNSASSSQARVPRTGFLAG